ncbi:MAG: Uroporphyrinogen synthase [Bacteroidetes bacterium]|jgi:uroporphyrinogen-III synthase|nr:Uroporphyrinogen synthase [Bacteroidota bacterium]
MAIKKKKSVKAPASKVVAKSSTKKNNKAKKSIVKKAVKKSTKKVVTKKAPVKKAAVKKIASKKAASKSVPVKSKKTAPKKAAAKKIIKKSAPVAKPKPAAKIKKSPAKKAIQKAPAVPKAKPEPKQKVQAAQKSEAVVSAEKFVKVGVKTKKQLVAVAPQPVIEVSNFPKLKVKTLLISQPKPENDKNPYYELSKKYNLIETFRQFIKIEGLPVKDFRTQRIDILEHKAVILTSRMAVDHYFRMCNEMRVTVPESMKYFCINEATAYYLQKYIQYRKRKIFFGHQTIQDLVDVIRKNREERFLLPAADVHKEQICEFLDAIDIKYTKAVMYRTVSADLSDIKNLNDFDILAFFTPAGINSLKHNFPNFKQGNTRIACFGAATANTLKKHGYRLDIYAPNPKNPSMSGALDEYIKEANKR